MTKKKYKVRGMDCAACASLIEMDLEDSGVKASCSYATEVLEIEFDERELTEEEVKKFLKKSGDYDLVSL